MEDFGTVDLEGRLEKVYIFGEHSTKCANGLVGRRHVLITNGNRYKNKNCLVRFDLVMKNPKSIFGNFISSEVPDNFEGLSSEEYLLYGVWGQNRGYPTIEEIRERFSPGDLQVVLYFKKGARRKKKRAVISSKGITGLDYALGYAVRERLPDPRRYSRVIIVEEEEQVERIVDRSYEAGIIPIRMEPLK